METKIGEVIEATTNGFVAEAYELYSLPPFGSLVKIIESGTEIYGIVCEASTTSIEPGRRTIARGKDEPSEEAIYQSSPQLMKLLRSEFTVVVVGWGKDGKIYHYLPARPAHIHAFIYPCDTGDIKNFSRTFDFLNLLVGGQTGTPVEELVAAALREMSRVQDDPHAFLVAAGKSLTVLLGSDYRRLRAILGRL